QARPAPGPGYQLGVPPPGFSPADVVSAGLPVSRAVKVSTWWRRAAISTPVITLAPEDRMAWLPSPLTPRRSTNACNSAGSCATLPPWTSGRACVSSMLGRSPEQAEGLHEPAASQDGRPLAGAYRARTG